MIRLSFDIYGHFASPATWAARNGSDPAAPVAIDPARALLPAATVEQLRDALSGSAGSVGACLRLATADGTRWLQGFFRRPGDSGAAPREAVEFVGVDVTAAREAARSARASADWFEGLVRHASDVITALTPEGEIRYESPALTRDLGYGPGELVGTNALEWIHPEDRERVATALESVARGGEEDQPVTVELRFRHADGHWVPYESRALPPAAFGSGLVVALSRNITERRKVQAALERSREKLQRSREKYATFFELTPVGLVLSDPDTGHMYEVNERFQEIFGYSRDELVGRTALELGLWDDPDRRFELVRKAREEGGFRGEDAVYRTREGERRRMLLSCRRLVLGGEDRMLWTVEDLTEQWRLEEELQLQRAALEATDHGIMISDREGTIEWVNPAFTEMTGYAAEEAVGRNPRILKSGEQEPSFYEELWEAILEGETWRGEIVNRRKDGTLYTESQSIVPVRHRSDEITHFVALKRDVTDRKVRADALRRSEERYRSLFEHSLDPITLTTPDGSFLDANDAFVDHFGYSRAELESLSVAELYRDPADRRRFLEMVLQAGELRGYELELTTSDGEVRTCLVSTRAHRDAEGEVQFLQAVLHDITELKRLQGRLRHQALHDPLTELANRTLLHDRLAQALARARRRGTSLALAVFDFDRFKRVNDSLGHTAGDRVLREAAARFRASTRGEETAARVGGDEFALLLEDVSDELEVRTALQRVRASLRSSYEVAGTTVRLDQAVGVALYEPGGDLPVEAPEDLLRYADIAMYDAKRREDRSLRFYRPALEGGRTTVVAREHRLRRAIEADELVPYYQPIVELSAGAVVGLEVLARWPHPDRGLLAPGEFIALAEESELIVALGYRLLDRACEQLATWDARGLTGDGLLRLFVNVSARQLADEEAVEHLVEIPRTHGLDPGRLVVELTETAVMRRPEQVGRLTNLDVGLAIDDFGTGYASLAYLKLLDVDLLKIDRSFVGGLDTDPEDTAIVEAVIGLARSLGVDVVAEGIETGPQRKRLAEMGCRLGQGFHIAHPAPASDAGDFLSATAARER